MGPFEASGFWHLPDVPSDQIAGVLRYSEADGLRLSLTGSFSKESGFEPKTYGYPLIHGIVNDSPYGRAFTLVDCFRAGRTVRMPGFATEEIHANRAFSADDFLSENDLLFDSVTVEPSALDSWMNTTGISYTSTGGDNTGRIIRYSRPETISVGLDAATFEIGFGWSESVSHRSYSLREKVRVTVEHVGRLPFEELSEQYVYPLQNFFTFATDRPNAFENVVLRNSELHSEDGGRPMPIHHLAQPIYSVKEARKHLLPHEMLFTYEDIRESSSTVVNGWFEFARTLRPFCLSFFGLLYAPGTFIEERFLTLIESLTLLFWGLEPNNPAVRGALDEATKTVQLLCPQKNSQWVADAMPSSAEMDLPWNLLKALDDRRDIMGVLIGDDPERFIDRVLATRSYCRYRGAAPRQGAAQGGGLYWLTEKLKMLVRAVVLERIGIDRDLVARLIKRNRAYDHLATIPAFD
jgi:hypothetical protein